MIAIIDYDMGNVGSIANMLSKLGHKASITNKVAELEVAEKIILPGVGSFDNGMENLRKLDLIDPLNRLVLQEKTPLLGICIGMQLLTEGSEEGELPGLGWIKGRTKRFQLDHTDLKVPHMGWNSLVACNESHPLYASDRKGERRYYFVHSYHVECDNKDHELATAQHGYTFACSIGKENIMGTQFHPEKSHRFGMELLNNFARYKAC